MSGVQRYLVMFTGSILLSMAFDPLVGASAFCFIVAIEDAITSRK